MLYTLNNYNFVKNTRCVSTAAISDSSVIACLILISGATELTGLLNYFYFLKRIIFRKRLKKNVTQLFICISLKSNLYLNKTSKTVQTQFDFHEFRKIKPHLFVRKKLQTKDLNRHSPRKIQKWPICTFKKCKTLAILKMQVKHGEILLPMQWDCYKKNRQTVTNVIKVTEKVKPSCIAGRNVKQ